MRLSILVLAALLPFLAACSTHTDVAIVDAAQAQLAPTVASYQAMTFTPVANPSEQYGPVGKGDPIYDFGYYGRSYFKAIELPRASTDYILEATNDTTYDGGLYLFFSNFVFLDAAKKPVPVLANQAPFFALGEKSFLRRTVRYVIPASTKARYVVIYASRDKVVSGEEVSYGSGGMVYAAGLFIPTGAPRAIIKGSQEGLIGIAIKSPDVAEE